MTTTERAAGLMGYDIIGDIHGHADALKALLTDMGYPDPGWRVASPITAGCVRG